MGAVRILLIEDDRLVAGMIRDTLAAEGWEVTVREDGGSGLAEIKDETPYDLIITDYELPGVDGVRLARCAHRASPEACAGRHVYGKLRRVGGARRWR